MVYNVEQCMHQDQAISCEGKLLHFGQVMAGLQAFVF